MQDDLKRMLDTGLIPIIRTRSITEAVLLADAIKDGGGDVIEITMTVPGALGIIEDLVAKYDDDVVVGAGTILDPETARLAILAGARFVVTPTLNLRVIELVKRYGHPVCPGALTPTEIVTAWEAGADVVKVFPCDAMGGAAYIKAVKAPLPQIRLVPTGGVNLDTCADFIKAGAACLGVGSALIDKTAVKEKNWGYISELTRKYQEIITNARQQA